MLELTDEQKEEGQKLVNCYINYWWKKLEAKVLAGSTYKAALEEIMKEITDN